MIMEALSWYVESLSAFWVSLTGGGLFRLILIWLLISLIRRRRMSWRRHRCRCRCSHCGCRCGHCPCGADGEGKDEKGGDDEEDEEAI